MSTPPTPLTGQALCDAVSAQTNAIQGEIKAQPMVGAIRSFYDATAPIWSEIHGNAIFEAKLRWLASPATAEDQNNTTHQERFPKPLAGFSAYRPVRRDGSCFYRSLWFDLLLLVAFEGHGLLGNGADSSRRILDRLLTAIKAARPALCEMYSDFVDDFAEVSEEQLEKARTIAVPALAGLQVESGGGALAAARAAVGDTLAAALCEDEMSFEYLVTFARYATAFYLRSHAIVFAPFLGAEEGFELDAVTQFCRTDVETVGAEAEQPQIMACAAFFGLSVSIYYVDNNQNEKKDAGEASTLQADPCTVFKVVGRDTRDMCGAAPMPDPLEGAPLADGALPLLYRPGHYELLSFA